MCSVFSAGDGAGRWGSVGKGVGRNDAGLAEAGSGGISIGAEASVVSRGDGIGSGRGTGLGGDGVGAAGRRDSGGGSGWGVVTAVREGGSTAPGDGGSSSSGSRSGSGSGGEGSWTSVGVGAFALSRYFSAANLVDIRRKIKTRTRQNNQNVLEKIIQNIYHSFRYDSNIGRVLPHPRQKSEISKQTMQCYSCQSC